MAQTKRTSTNRRRSNPPASSAGKWIILLLLIVIVLLAYVVAHLWKKETHMGGGSGQHDARSVKKPDTKPVIKPDFEFYTLLPKQNNGPVIATPEQPLSPGKSAPQDKSAQSPESRQPAQSSYWIQAGSFATAAEADRRKAEIAMQGFVSEVHPAIVNGKQYFRIQIGPIPQDRLAAVRKRLSEAHIDTLPPKVAQ